MHRMILLCLLVVSSSSWASVYTWTCPGSVSVVTRNGSCGAIAGAWADRLAFVGYRPDTGAYGAQVAYTESGCSAASAEAVSDSITVTLAYLVAAAPPVSGTTTAACAVASIVDDYSFGVSDTHLDKIALSDVLTLLAGLCLWAVGFRTGAA